MSRWRRYNERVGHDWSDCRTIVLVDRLRQIFFHFSTLVFQYWNLYILLSHFSLWLHSSISLDATLFILFDLSWFSFIPTKFPPSYQLTLSHNQPWTLQGTSHHQYQCRSRFNFYQGFQTKSGEIRERWMTWKLVVWIPVWPLRTCGLFHPIPGFHALSKLRFSSRGGGHCRRSFPCGQHLTLRYSLSCKCNHSRPIVHLD